MGLPDLECPVSGSKARRFRHVGAKCRASVWPTPIRGGSYEYGPLRGSQAVDEHQQAMTGTGQLGTKLVTT